MNASSPSLSEIELTIALPWTHFNPASITSHFDESIISGTRAMSGSAAMRFRKRVIAALESSIASSMLTSIICAPFCTCERATSTAPAKSPERIRRENTLEPVTFVRSPTLTKSESSPIASGSRPARRMGVGDDSFADGLDRVTAVSDLTLVSDTAWPQIAHCLRDRADMRGRRAAAPADDIDEAALREILEHPRRLLGRFVVARIGHRVGKAGVRVTR